ncbi:MAG: type IV secretory pathway VirB6-like protein [Rickettsiales bacterium]
MKINIFIPNFKQAFYYTLLLICCFLSSTQNSLAVQDYARIEMTDANGDCKTKKLNFAPAFDNYDITWETDNPICIAYRLGAGLTLFTARNAAANLCNDQISLERMWREKFLGISVSPWAIKEIAKDTTGCAGYATSCALGNSPSCPTAVGCCAALAGLVSSYGIAMGQLALIYAAAVNSQENARICGNKWKTSELVDAAGIVPNYVSGTIKSYDSNWNEVPNKVYSYGARLNSIQKAREDGYKNIANKIFGSSDMANKNYREYYHGGVEYEDNGAGACKNPASWDSEMRMKILGYDSEYQRYYMRGSNEESNYACKTKFLLANGTTEQKDDANLAFECCSQRSQETICIEEKPLAGFEYLGNGHVFCKMGTRCTIGAGYSTIFYTARPKKDSSNYICATTYTACPYNHYLGGGTEEFQYDAKYPSVQTNRCSYLKHCSIIPSKPIIVTESLDGSWLSSACFDLKGDSQNQYSFQSGLTPLNKTRHFSAPIVQCFKETIENMFVNKAGHSKCSDPSDKPDKDGNCASGFKYKEGEHSGRDSMFQNLQETLQSSIKLVMTIAITIMGISLLLKGEAWDKKTIMMFVVKLGLVSFFALGTAWQNYFFEGVSSASTEIAGIFMRIDTASIGDQVVCLPDPNNSNSTDSSSDGNCVAGYDSPNQDGCQFPKYNHSDDNESTRYNRFTASYPLGKGYLKIWDTLDCKIAKALGYAPEVSVPNLALMIFAGLITSGLGMIFFVATFIFAFYLIALTIRAIHIFLISSMAIVIMIYISPITITASLFKKTESIFVNWRTHLISLILQPVILFAYLGILITIFDQVIVGSATFSGSGIDSPKEIVCSSVNAANDSIYCIFGFDKMLKNVTALEPLGITLASLISMNKEKLATIMKAAFLLFILTSFLDKIPELATKILGGSSINSKSIGTAKMAASAYSGASAVQKRGSGMMSKNVLPKAASYAKGVGAGIKRSVGLAGKKDNVSIKDLKESHKKNDPYYRPKSPSKPKS